MQNTRKVIITIFFMVILGISVNAQDIIITKSKEKIEAKITEIELETVKYKRFKDQEGAVYVIKKNDIASIYYENGKTETFEMIQEEEEKIKEERETYADVQLEAERTHFIKYVGKSIHRQRKPSHLSFSMFGF